MKVLRALVMAYGVFVTITPLALAANELNDSIQAFHRGNYATAGQGLNQLINSGSKDARVYYYRGLIFLRQGNHQAAATDFQAAMQLEASGHGGSVSAALERVQGQERLVVEKYRAMARLASRNRKQTPAPAPDILGSSGAVQPTAVEIPSRQPLFRLASEIPLRQIHRPEATKKESLVVDGAPKQPVVVPSTSDEPVGTGVADEVDPFAEFGDPVAEGGIAPTSPPAGKTRSAVGGLFRALFRANVPQIPLQGVIPPGMPGAPQPGAAGPEFGEPAGEEPAFGEDEFGFGEETTDEDPFDGF